jgi:rhamnose utilization protein RhaD (predicted bifunctional aldolase and dehydrogenase)
MWIKASGVSLATIEAGGFCAMDRGKLAQTWHTAYPSESKAREAAILADLMAARLSGQNQRPSVETLLHDLFPQTYVVHTHPGVINGLTCSKDGEALFNNLFGDEAVWVPCVDPGLVLARAVRTVVDTYRSRTGKFPSFMFMQNHGLLVAADTPEGIREISARIMTKLEALLVRVPDKNARAVPLMDLADCSRRLAALAPGASVVVHRAEAEMLRLADSTLAFHPLSAPFTPDHIVYAGHEFLYVAAPDGLEAAWNGYQERNHAEPRIVLVKGLGAFAVAARAAVAETAMLFFQDACSIAVFAESFGGVSHMAAPRVEFIRDWEVEHYRAKASLAK